MQKDEHLMYLYGDNGQLRAVMLSAELWEKKSSKLLPIVDSFCTPPKEKSAIDPTKEWDIFKKYWDFSYPYNAQVECGSCGAHAEDWTTDPENTFSLRSAQLGGLAVFTCNKCSTLIRKKHFKDHICFEHSIQK